MCLKSHGKVTDILIKKTAKRFVFVFFHFTGDCQHNPKYAKRLDCETQLLLKLTPEHAQLFHNVDCLVRDTCSQCSHFQCALVTASYKNLWLMLAVEK